VISNSNIQRVGQHSIVEINQNNAAFTHASLIMTTTGTEKKLVLKHCCVVKVKRYYSLWSG